MLCKRSSCFGFSANKNNSKPLASHSFKSFISKSNCLLNVGCMRVLNPISKPLKLFLSNSTTCFKRSCSSSNLELTKSSGFTSFKIFVSSSSSIIFLLPLVSSITLKKISRSSSCNSMRSFANCQSSIHTTVLSGKNSSKETLSPASN